jgi:crotonobetainyl-CoA:carnitine CoA-transferase CaiB-like acyl-CoA transferase
VKKDETSVKDAPMSLSGYRALDLTEGGAMLCGKFLGNLGMDVIKIEKPGGSPSRDIGPFYKNKIDREWSLFWWALNNDKRGVTLNIETADGRELFKRLVQTADFVIESFPPMYLNRLGLGYDSLAAVNQRIILTSITPWGQTGPYAHWKASDLVSWSMGGYTYVTGDRDRPPLWIGVPAAFLNAGAEAASASLIAHWYREATGEGQQVDVSVQECIHPLLMFATQYWDIGRFNAVRGGKSWILSGNTELRLLHPCKDGQIVMHLLGGGDPAAIYTLRRIIAWMDEENMAPDWLKQMDLINDFDGSKATPELVDRVAQPFAKFFKTKTRQELYERALKEDLILTPVNMINEVWEDPNLWDRQFWVEVDHPELRRKLRYPGYPVRMSATPTSIRRRAPRIGEHNEEIYMGEIGLSREDLAVLKSAGVI